MNDSNLSSQTLRKLLSYKSTVYIIFCTKRWKLTETYSLWSNNFNDMCKMLCTLFITNFSSFFLSSFRAASRSNFNIMWNDPTQKPITKYFILHDLWLSFEKWSAYGAKTKLVIVNRELGGWSVFRSVPVCNSDIHKQALWKCKVQYKRYLCFQVNFNCVILY